MIANIQVRYDFIADHKTGDLISIFYGFLINVSWGEADSVNTRINHSLLRDEQIHVLLACLIGGSLPIRHAGALGGLVLPI
jgi:hypothetical protein